MKDCKIAVPCYWDGLGETTISEVLRQFANTSYTRKRIMRAIKDHGARNLRDVDLAEAKIKAEAKKRTRENAQKHNARQWALKGGK